ncbi:hypothetical protein L227DRAFT_582010, partial [Lentinus tigrinus ALCF2SS1-6]
MRTHDPIRTGKPGSATDEYHYGLTSLSGACSTRTSSRRAGHRGIQRAVNPFISNSRFF